MIRVIKRDGSETAFSSKKIVSAILAAFNATVKSDKINYSKIALKLSVSISDKIKATNKRKIEISEINEFVEAELLEHYQGVHKAFKSYRQQRDIEREKKSSTFKAIRGILEQTDSKTLLENANKDATVIPTMRDLVAGAASKSMAEHILPTHIMDAHKSGDIHFHDLDYSPAFPSFNCMSVDLANMLKRGFNMSNTEIESPKSILSACSITAQIIAQVASHIYGGTTIDNLDKTLAPYLELTLEKHKKHLISVFEKLGNKVSEQQVLNLAKEASEKDCYDAMQGLEYNVNSLSTSQGQTPFVTFAFGRGTSWAERSIQKSILNVRLAGLGKNGKTPTFPKLVYYTEAGVNLNSQDVNYDIKNLSLECSAKRLYPDYLSVKALEETIGHVCAPMGCRSYLSDFKGKDGKSFSAGRNNLGVVSINLPRIAIESKGDISKFYELLDERLELAFEALQERINRFKGVTAAVAPILYQSGAMGKRLKPTDPIMPLFENGRATISFGYIGIHETVLSLTGKTMFDDPVSYELGLNIVKYMKGFANICKRETGFAYSLYSTPSENLCDRFCRLDREKFGIIENVNDKDYYTNSFHLDVEQKTDPFSKFDYEAPFPMFASGGFISYAEFPDMKDNIQALERVIDYAYHRNPYIGINVPSDECYSCGYTGELSATSKGFVCPNCGESDIKKLAVIRRVCGYLSSNQPNHGKLEEIKRRVKHC